MERKTITAGAVTYLLLLAGCIALIRPFVNAGISDDFGYIRSAKDFADTGRLVYNGSATAMLGWLVPLGALFVKLFGFSFTAVRIASFLIAAANGVLLQWILLRLGCSRVQALFGATAVLLSPVSLREAMLFFTDGPGLLAMLVTLELCIRIVRAKTPRATQFWIAAAFLTSFFLGTVRQLLWMTTLIMVPCAIWLVRKRKGVVPWAAACFALAALGIGWTLHWWNRQPYALNEPLILHYPLQAWASYLVFPGMELLVVLAPVLSLFLLRRVPPKVYVVSGALALIAPLAMVRNPHGLLSLGSQYIFGEAPEWIFLLALAYVFGMLPIMLRIAYEAFTEDRRTERHGQIDLRQLAILLGPFSLVVFLLVITRAAFFLRYLLEVMAALTILLVKLWSDLAKKKQGCGIAGPVLVGVYCAFSVIVTHDLFRRTEAILSLTQQYAAQGMPRSQLEAGFAFDGWYQIERTGYINDSRIRVPAGAYVNHDVPHDIARCHNFFLSDTPSIHPVYGMGETMAPCLEAPVLYSAEYTAWMTPHHHRIFLARFAPKYAMPVR